MTYMKPFWERPCAASGLTSYRYRGRYGFIMIGAPSDNSAMREAARSSFEPIEPDRLERWNGTSYAPVLTA